MKLSAGLETYNFGLLLRLCWKNGWKRSGALVTLVKESPAFKQVYLDHLAGRLDWSRTCGVVRNRTTANHRRVRLKTVCTTGFTDDEAKAISFYALSHRITVAYALERLLIQSPTFLEFLNSQIVQAEEASTTHPHL